MSFWREEKSYHESCKSHEDTVTYYCFNGFVDNLDNTYCPVWFAFENKLHFQNLYFRDANGIAFGCSSFDEAKVIIKLFASSCEQSDRSLLEFLKD